MARKPHRSKLYTGGGDRGETSLLGGTRVPKNDLRVAAYGSLDELNSSLGVAISFTRQRKIVASLERIQRDLFSAGAELANDTKVGRQSGNNPRLQFDPGKTRWLEGLIDEYDSRVPPLRNFILPSGASAAAFLHHARAVCRRTERDVFALSREDDINPAILTYLNRLSDLLFAVARYVNKAARSPEHLWRKDE